MNIQEILQKCKVFYEDADTFFVAVLTLTALLSFGLGRLSVSHPAPVALHAQANLSSAGVWSASNTEAVLGGYVASQTGTKYHLPWCAGAQQMKEENKVWFASKEEAEAAGYEPAENCKGI